MSANVKDEIKRWLADLAVAVLAGVIVGIAYFYFQNSNGFAPGGVGGLATMTFHYIEANASFNFPWWGLMLLFNLPIFILVSIYVNRRLGVILIVYMLVQSLSVALFETIGLTPYSKETDPEDFEIVFAAIATGLISGAGFSLMFRRFGASGGTYAISALIKKKRPETNVAYVAFILDASVVFIALFAYGKVTPVICTLMNLFVANVVVDNVLSGLRNGYKFEIVTENPEELSRELIERLKHGVTEIRVLGMYSHTEKYMLVCIVRKRQIGEMMKIIQKYKGSFACFSKVNEVFGRFKK